MNKPTKIGSTYYMIHPQFESQALQFIKNKENCRLIGTQLADSCTLRIWWIDNEGKLDCQLEDLQCIN